MTDQKINAAPDLRKWRTEIPNLYDDADLNVYEFRLLVHYCRVGRTYENVRTTAKKTGMSHPMVIKTRNSLEKKGFIRTGQSDFGTIEVTVVDKWDENFKRYSGKPRDQASKPRDQAGHTVESKKEPVKKEPVKKGSPNGEAPKITAELRKQAEDYFRKRTGLSPLPGDTKRVKSQNAARWWAPLRTLCEMGEGDWTKTKAIMDGCFEILEPDMIFAPQSLINTAPRAKVQINRPDNNHSNYSDDLARRKAEAARLRGKHAEANA